MDAVNRVFRVLIGAFLGVVLMSVAVYVVRLLAASSPFPLSLWRTRVVVVLYASEAIAFLPIALVLGVVMTRIFASSRVTNAVISMAIALAIGFIGSLTEQQATLSSLAEMPGLAAAFLVGVPAVVLVLERLRSNKLYAVPRERKGS
jgi:hypothetical protein